MEEIKNCPYCSEVAEADSKDHIFSRFLGGTKKIPACRNCNNTIFGKEFEGRVAKNIHTWHAIISSWGVTLKADIPVWKNAQTDKNRLNISVTDEGLKGTHSKPIIERSEDGRFEHGIYRTKQEAESHLKSLNANGISVHTTEITWSEEHQVRFLVEFSIDLFRLVLKMCSSLFTLQPDFDKAELSIARALLTGENKEGPVSNIQYSFDTFEEVSRNRPSFAHTIYVERTKNGNFGLVQFFGVFQFICKLGTPEGEKEDCALLAFLDPITGEEKFETFIPIPLGALPVIMSKEEREQNVRTWIKTLNIEAQKRGARVSDTEIFGVNQLE
jgi:hypothetical protein